MMPLETTILSLGESKKFIPKMVVDIFLNLK